MKILKLAAKILALFAASMLMKWFVWWMLAIYVLLQIPARFWNANVGYRLNAVAGYQEDKPSHAWLLTAVLVTLVAVLFLVAGLD